MFPLDTSLRISFVYYLWSVVSKVIISSGVSFFDSFTCKMQR